MKSEPHRHASALPPAGHFARFMTAVGLLAGLRIHDFRAAANFLTFTHPERSLPFRLLQFIKWTIHQMFEEIPVALHAVTFAKSFKRSSVWLANGNPLANYPGAREPAAKLSQTLIHWSSVLASPGRCWDIFGRSTPEQPGARDLGNG